MNHLSETQKKGLFKIKCQKCQRILESDKELLHYEIFHGELPQLSKERGGGGGEEEEDDDGENLIIKKAKVLSGRRRNILFCCLVIPITIVIGILAIKELRSYQSNASPEKSNAMGNTLKLVSEISDNGNNSSTSFNESVTERPIFLNTTQSSSFQPTTLYKSEEGAVTENPIITTKSASLPWVNESVMEKPVFINNTQPTTPYKSKESASLTWVDTSLYTDEEASKCEPKNVYIQWSQLRTYLIQNNGQIIPNIYNGTPLLVRRCLYFMISCDINENLCLVSNQKLAIRNVTLMNENDKIIAYYRLMILEDSECTCTNETERKNFGDYPWETPPIYFAEFNKT